MNVNLPQDPMILFSYVNTKLRDEYSSLDIMCEETGIDKEALLEKLRAAGFEYDPSQNKFW